jgi:hypothetical protein
MLRCPQAITARHPWAEFMDFTFPIPCGREGVAGGFYRHQHQIRLPHGPGQFSFLFRRSVGVGRCRSAAIFAHPHNDARKCLTSTGLYSYFWGTRLYVSIRNVCWPDCGGLEIPRDNSPGGVRVTNWQQMQPTTKEITPTAIILRGHQLQTNGAGWPPRKLWIALVGSRWSSSAAGYPQRVSAPD